MNDKNRRAGKKNFIMVLLIITLFIFSAYGAAASSQPATGSLKIGAYVNFGFFKGGPVFWQVIHNDTNGSVLFSNEILTYKAFDARGDKADGRDSKYNTRIAEGSNYWPKANIREWLNSDAAVAYTHQKPDAQHTLTFGSEDLSYAQEPGFLSSFTGSEKAIIQPVRHKVMLSSFDAQVKDGGSYLWKPELEGDSAYFQWVTDKVFLLSWKELHEWVVKNNLSIEAPWFTFKDRSMHNQYWLRTPAGDYADAVFSVAGSRITSNMNAYRAMGIRPALYVKPGLEVSGSGTKENPYIIDTSNVSAKPVIPPAAASTDIAIYIDGEKQVFADRPVMVQGRTLLPMRVLFQALGAEVEWDVQNNTAVGIRDGVEVRIPIGSTIPTINGNPATINVPARLIGGRTYIPLRFVGEALGDEVVWDEQTGSVLITKKGQ